MPIFAPRIECGETEDARRVRALQRLHAVFLHGLQRIERRLLPGKAHLHVKQIVRGLQRRQARAIAGKQLLQQLFFRVQQRQEEGRVVDEHAPGLGVHETRDGPQGLAHHALGPAQEIRKACRSVRRLRPRLLCAAGCRWRGPALGRVVDLVQAQQDLHELRGSQTVEDRGLQRLLVLRRGALLHRVQRARAQQQLVLHHAPDLLQALELQRVVCGLREHGLDGYIGIGRARQGLQQACDLSGQRAGIAAHRMGNDAGQRQVARVEQMRVQIKDACGQRHDFLPDLLSLHRKKGPCSQCRSP